MAETGLFVLISGDKRCLFISMSGEIIMFIDIYEWQHKDVHLYLYLVNQRCLFISMSSGTKMLLKSMCCGTKMFTYIFVWWHKCINLHLYLVKQR